MVVLFILFVVQFSIACACLAFGKSQQMELATRGWRESNEYVKQRTQTFFGCCGFNETVTNVKSCPNVSKIIKIKNKKLI